MRLRIKAMGLAATSALLGFCANAAEPGVANSATCNVTNPKGGMSGNDVIGVVLPEQGKFIFRPGGPGFIDRRDGALGVKVGWLIAKKGTLSVTGRRLDGAAPPARAYISRSYDNYSGGMSLALVFPTPGCWEVTSTLADASLTFTVQVEKIGEGPAGYVDGPPRGSRVTGGSI